MVTQNNLVQVAGRIGNICANIVLRSQNNVMKLWCNSEAESEFQCPIVSI